MGSTTLNRTGYGNMSDGRSKSSPFQKEGWKEVWDEATSTTKLVPVEGGTQEIISTKQTGKATRKKPQVNEFRKACYVNGVFQKGKTINGILCEFSKDFKKSDELETKDLLRESETEKFTPEEKEKPKGKTRMCKCKAFSQYALGGSGTGTSYQSYVSYPCGEEGDGKNPSDFAKHPNCRKPSEEEKRANLDATTGKSSTYGVQDKETEDFKGGYLGEGKGSEQEGYSQSVREAEASKKKYKQLLKELKGDMSSRQWKKYRENNPGWQAELKKKSRTM